GGGWCGWGGGGGGGTAPGSASGKCAEADSTDTRAGAGKTTCAPSLSPLTAASWRCVTSHHITPAAQAAPINASAGSTRLRRGRDTGEVSSAAIGGKAGTASVSG